jgi:murein DD-endopeptidase MepM/ murein hydrolase activator NlpD
MASGPGVVDFSAWYSARGGFAKFIRYDAGFRCGYYHLPGLDGLSVGDRVDYGTVFAYVGTTGASTGPHLHHEVWVNGQIMRGDTYWNYIDMNRYVGDGSAAGEEVDMPLTPADKQIIKDAILEFFMQVDQPPAPATDWPFFRTAVWGQPINAMDAQGNYLYHEDGSPVLFRADGFLASTNALIQADRPADVAPSEDAEG